MQNDSNGSISALNANLSTGVPTANSFVQLSITSGFDTASVQVVGAWVGTLIVQGSLDGKNWVTLNSATSLTNTNTQAQSSTIASAAQGIWKFDVAAANFVRVTASAWTSGTANITLAAGIGTGIVAINNPLTLAAGTASIGTVATPGGTAHSLLSAASTNATSVKATAGNLFETTITNYSAATKYIKFYDKASAPTVGTDSPILVIEIAANSSKYIPFGNIGKRFGTGIALAITGAQAIADTTAVAAGDVRLHSTYI